MRAARILTRFHCRHRAQTTLTKRLKFAMIGFIKVLDGLYFMVAQEERRIRQDPIARTTALLKKVFG